MNRFDTMAAGFDTNPRVKRAKAVADELRSHISSAGKTAIEYGCGTGLVGLNLSDDFSSLTFIDSSAGMVDELQKKIAGRGASKLHTLCCDLMEELPAGLRTDHIFMSLVLHHISDTKKALGVFHEMLNEGGHLLIVDLDTEDGSFHAEYPDFDGHNGYDQSALAALAKSAGFKSVTSRTFFHDVKNVNGSDIPYSMFILDAKKQMQR